jgi:hypothetical protein
MQAKHRPEDFRPDVPPGYLPRRAFLALSDLAVGSYTSLVQRGQLPMMPPPPDAPKFLLQEALYPVPESELEWFDVRGWSPVSALAFIIAQMFIAEHTCSRDRATAIARHTLALHRRWPQITEAADRIIASDPTPPPDVLFAAIGAAEHPQIAVGTLSEMAAQCPHPASIIAVSATQAALTLRRRALDYRIDISGFWETGR